MAVYFVANAAVGTTAAPTVTATGTAIKTHLQIAPSSGNPITILEWGISFNGTSVAAPIPVELITTTGAATVTAHVAANVTPFLRSSDVGATGVTLGTAATGYNASAEGTPGTLRYGDLQMVAPTNQYIKQYPMGREFFVPGGTYMRIRTTSAASVSCYCYVIFMEY